jgi:hypothetical protein
MTLDPFAAASAVVLVTAGATISDPAMVKAAVVSLVIVGMSFLPRCLVVSGSFRSLARRHLRPGSKVALQEVQGARSCSSLQAPGLKRQSVS